MMTTRLHGFTPGGSDKSFFLPFKVTQKQMSQEEFLTIGKDKLAHTFAPKIAVDMLIRYKRRVLYHLPNGLYAVKK
jgi:hypothetical protein